VWVFLLLPYHKFQTNKLYAGDHYISRIISWSGWEGGSRMDFKGITVLGYGIQIQYYLICAGQLDH
jgi:hypothetical protein